ncbi:DNA polymerase epsilon subunit B-like isoform X2 [Pyrus communis]|uniref:DNA polymerase epsilon subunit B-like isoform X2 n=1 Tax=Pyrus communis TaxID=23211 RepID=UPI0035C0BE00
MQLDPGGLCVGLPSPKHPGPLNTSLTESMSSALQSGHLLLKSKSFLLSPSLSKIVAGFLCLSFSNLPTGSGSKPRRVKRKSCRVGILPGKDKETVHRLATKLSRADAAIYDGDDDCVTSTSEPDWHIIDAFKVPKFRYDPIKKSFYKHAGRLPIHGEASAKSALHKDRLLLLSQIISRHKEFSRPAFGSKSSDSGPHEISPIQSLIGQTGRRWVMGMISQLEDGHFYLEDLSSSVEIDLSNAISFTHCNH